MTSNPVSKLRGLLILLCVTLLMSNGSLASGGWVIERDDRPDSPLLKERKAIALTPAQQEQRALAAAYQKALQDEQQPLVMADTFRGEPGLSAPLLESDFAPRKPYCDVLLHGSAHAPGGRPATQVTVGLQAGSLSKTFRVVGERRWDCGVTQLRSTPPLPFITQPIGYDVAWAVHASIFAYGMALLDNALLEPLARACAEEGRDEFMLVIAPLCVPGRTGSPANPLALF